MEDDEEYSYSSYSKDTQALIDAQDRQTMLVGDDEEYSFKGFSAEKEQEGQSAADVSSYGDFIVEEFSPEVSVKRISRFMRLPENAVTYIIAAIYAVVGCLCVFLTDYINLAFPYIVGGFMCLLGVGQLASAIKTKEYVHTHSNKTATSLVLIALSIMILVEYDWAYVLIAMGWGFFGLFEGAHAINHAFSRIARSERSAYYLCKGMVELVLAFILLYEPTEHIRLHIWIFGVQLIFDAFTMLPVVKNILSK
jgi:uncharacterized membrane protein HdeD (DUF308 family)